MSNKEQKNSIIRSLSAVGKAKGASLKPEKKAAHVFQSGQKRSREIPSRLTHL